MVCKITGEVQFDPAYNGNLLVNAMAVGVARTDNTCVDDPRPLDRAHCDLGGATLDPRVDLLELLGSENMGSRAWIYRQYDPILRDGTLLRPGEGDAAVVRASCDDGATRREKLLAISTDFNGRFCELDPRQGAAINVAPVTRGQPGAR